MAPRILKSLITEIAFAMIPIAADFVANHLKSQGKPATSKVADDDVAPLTPESVGAERLHQATVLHETAPDRTQFENICRAAMPCERCFAHASLSRAYIDLPQPRYVGEGYWSADERVLFLMINPGAGAGSEQDHRARQDFADFKSGSIGVNELFVRQREHMEAWSAGRFIEYLNKIGLKVESMAFLNVAWCSTKANQYPSSMLETCFYAFTRDAVRALAPTKIIACGETAEKYARRLGVPFAAIPHFAARRPPDFEIIRRVLATIGQLTHDTLVKVFDGEGNSAKDEGMPRAYNSSSIIRLLRTSNPKSGKSFDRYACYVDGMTVAQYKREVTRRCGAAEAGKCAADLKWDQDHGFIRTET